MVTISATKMMVAFYVDHPHTLARFIENCFEGDKPQHPFSREETVFEGMSLVFPGLKSLILPIHSVHTADKQAQVSFKHVRYGKFSRWGDIRREDPQTTLLAMDRMQNIQVGTFVWEWKEKRFPTIIWCYRLELEENKSARYGEEHLSRFESIYFTLYEPGWEKKHKGHVTFEAGTLKPIKISEVQVQLSSKS